MDDIAENVNYNEYVYSQLSVCFVSVSPISQD